ASFRIEIKRIELLTGIITTLQAVQPHEFKEYISASLCAKWISDGNWRLIAGSADDLILDKPEEESRISEPDLFSGTGFDW
ncbi:MAG: hypothetical protein ABFR50_08225, partial [Candidatus Fermentibacteria bacterium]